MIVFRLPYPLSVNGLYYNHRAGGRSGTQAHRVWRMEAMQEILSQRAKLTEKEVRGTYSLHLVVSRTGHRGRRADLGNLEKAVSDVLVKMGIVEDDSLAERILLEWGDVEGCEVRIAAIDGAVRTP